jgi:hypothetical protein
VEKRIPKFFNKGKKERLEGIQKNIRWEDKFSLISLDKKKNLGQGCPLCFGLAQYQRHHMNLF